MPIVTITNTYPGFTLLLPTTEKVIRTIAESEKCRIENISIIVTDDKTLNQLKKEYFRDDVLTDTISFNFNETGQAVDGEIYISVDRIRENANKYHTSFRTELALVIIHGVLHLMGYEDSSLPLKQQMDNLQQHYLNIVPLKMLYRKAAQRPK